MVLDHWNGTHMNQVEDYTISWARSFVTRSTEPAIATSANAGLRPFIDAHAGLRG